MGKPDYDTTVARIAGNLLSGFAFAETRNAPEVRAARVEDAVSMARAIVAETRRTAPTPKETDL